MSTTDTKPGAAVELPFQIYARQLEKLPPCQARCPNSGDIRDWLGIIAQREKRGLGRDEAFDEAWRRLVGFNPLPATIGRICPHPCEDLCSRSNKDGAVSINAMERFLGDWGLARGLSLPEVPRERHPESVGVVGSGPASLSFAYQMAVRGYKVTIYDRDERPGVKFADMELLGLPHRLVIGDRGLKDGVVEYQNRRGGEGENLPLGEAKAQLLAKLRG